ncbi:hypothetical protein LJC29_03895 [Bacteroides sp. OttesenSCG-928-N06]|nr:hypothetical protein [Bacteroides sp. OttesenSCG-928-N06]
MSHRLNLSTAFNMTLGFIPVIASIVLALFLFQSFAIYIGAIIGLACSVVNYNNPIKRIPNFLLYIVTAILLVLSAITLINISDWKITWFPLALEVAVLLPLAIIYLFKNKFVDYFRRKPLSRYRCSYIQAAESTIVSTKVTLLLAVVQFIVLLAFVFFAGPPEENLVFRVLLMTSPLLVFVLSIVFNQLGIAFFNRVVSTQNFVPVINQKGDVVSKVVKEDIGSLSNDVMIPIVRIAIESHGMLFLSRNNRVEMKDREQTDSPLETFIMFKESVEHAARRILRTAFPTDGKLDPRFSIRYRFKNEKENRMVYLFVLHLDDDKPLCDCRFTAGKLWTTQQIEHNLDKNFFTEHFEYEYEHLKDIIDTREKYKVS